MRVDPRPTPEPTTQRPANANATPIAFVRAIVAAYRRYGMDPSGALARAQIAPQLLAAPGACISALQMEQVSGAAMQELDDEALGWFSRRLPWGSYGMLARASISAPNLGVALARWCRHHALLTGDVQLSLTVAGDTATLRIDEQRRLGALREFCLVSLLRNVHGVACWLINSQIPLQGSSFPFRAPPHTDAYRILFPGEVCFESGPASICWDARYLALPLQRDEAALQQMLRRALPLTVRAYRRDSLLVERTRQVLAANPAQVRSAEGLAALLHVSTRTLHRQLKEKGASLQSLKDAVRREHAIRLLQRTDKPIKQVAAASGFDNEKSFIRAFRNWTGESPARFRRSSTVAAVAS